MAEDEERQTRWRDEKERLYRNEFWKKNPEKLAMLNHFAGIALPLVMAMPDSKWHWDFSGHYGESTSVADEYALAAYSIAWAMLRAFEDVS